MKRMTLSGALVCLVATACGCGSSPTAPTSTPVATPAPAPAPTPTPTVTVTSVTISGTTTFSNLNLTGQLTAAANLSNGTTLVVTSQATWQSSNTSVATISSTGLLTAVGIGVADIRAAYQGVTGLTQITVSNTPLNLTGTFSGRATASDGSSGPMRLVLTQTGSSISGFGTTFYEFNRPEAAVLVAGTVSGGRLTLTLMDNDGSCPKQFTHTVTAATNSSITGTYVKRGGCSDTTVGGTFAISR